MKESSTKLFVIALIGTICFCLFIFIKQLIKEYKSRNSILNGYFVSADMFLKKWNERYKNETWNKSGCYVILIYSHAIKEFHKEKYEAIYIGQSLHLANRVKQHLQGNGNKNVYHDYQNGKQIYIHLERCMPSYMNRMEKDLIRSFKATRSYNIQKGGGKHRRNNLRNTHSKHNRQHIRGDARRGAIRDDNGNGLGHKICISGGNDRINSIFFGDTA